MPFVQFYNDFSFLKKKIMAFLSVCTASELFVPENSFSPFDAFSSSFRVTLDFLVAALTNASFHTHWHFGKRPPECTAGISCISPELCSKYIFVIGNFKKKNILLLKGEKESGY